MRSRYHPIIFVSLFIYTVHCVAEIEKPMPAVTTEKNTLQLEVIDSFIEMHTGPGRGYPVFHVIEQGEIIEVLKRKPGWYQIRSKNGKLGWVKARQVSRTLMPTGVPVDLPSVGHGDYLKTRWRIGFTSGQFEGASSISLAVGYRLINWLGLEVEVGQIFGASVNSDYYSMNALIEPFHQWAITPYALIGTGRISPEPKQKLLDVDINETDFYSYGIGARYYLGRNFVIRGEFRNFSLSANNNRVNLTEWRIGVSTFF